MLAGHLQRYSRKCYEDNLKEYSRQKRNRRADGKEEEELAREEVDDRAQQATENRVIGILMDSTAASGVSKREVFQKLSAAARPLRFAPLGRLPRIGCTLCVHRMPSAGDMLLVACPPRGTDGHSPVACACGLPFP